MDDIGAAAKRPGSASALAYKYGADNTMTDSVVDEFRHVAADESADYARRLDAFVVLYNCSIEDIQSIAQRLLEEADYTDDDFWSLIASRTGLSPSEKWYADDSPHYKLLDAASADDNFFRDEMRRISKSFTIDENDDWPVGQDKPPGGYVARSFLRIVTPKRPNSVLLGYFGDMTGSGILNVLNRDQMTYLFFMDDTGGYDADILDTVCSPAFPDIKTDSLTGSGWDWLLNEEIFLPDDILNRSINDDNDGDPLKYFCVIIHHWDKKPYGLPLTPFTTLRALFKIPHKHLVLSAENADRLIVCDVTYRASISYSQNGFGDAVSQGYKSVVRIYVQNCHTEETEDIDKLYYNPPGSFETYAPPKYVFGEIDWNEVTDKISEYFE